MTSKRTTRIIHYLEAGLPLCRFDSGMPKDWPPGHTWAVRPSDPGTQTPQVNCAECRKRHEGDAPDPIIGARVVRIRVMTKEELDREGWETDHRERPMAIELSTGAVLYASRDEEGNGPGVIFGWDGKHTVAFGTKEVDG